MNGFKTKINVSNNRQLRKSPDSELNLPGLTVFGNTQEELETGPDMSTVRTLIPSVDNITSTFQGNPSTGEYTYSFGVAEMSEAESEIEHFTLDNQLGEVQEIGPVWVGRDPVQVNGTTVYTRYEGIKYDLTLAEIVDEGDGTVSGSTRSTYEKLEADALDYVGDFIWVNVKGKTKTQGLVIESIGIGPSTIDLGADQEGNVVNVASDERLKENIEPIQGALEKVLGLKGVTYNWKDRKAGGDALRIGFVAQQVKDVVPELVYDTGNDGYMGVWYNNAVPLIIEAIKELVENRELLPTTETQTKEVNVEVIYSEDNSIELNYGGTHETALGGGIVIKKGKSEEEDSHLKTDDNGDWELLPNIKVKRYTPTSTDDIKGNTGNIAMDDDYIYIKTASGWKRTALENF